MIKENKEPRRMDGVFFRVCRDGKWQNICFSDLTNDERTQVLDKRDAVWLRGLCCILADTLYELGNYFERDEVDEE